MIFFICHGNVARSQFAEALLRQKGITDVMSAGTSVSEEKEGNELLNDGATASKMVDYFYNLTGIDISTKTRTMVTPELAEQADVIVVMTKEEDLPWYLDKHRAKLMFWDIEDPHDMNIDGCRRVIMAVKEGINELINKRKFS
jgi:protein-tyrosine-phosphatase